MHRAEGFVAVGLSASCFLRPAVVVTELSLLPERHYAINTTPRTLTLTTTPA